MAMLAAGSVLPASGLALLDVILDALNRRFEVLHSVVPRKHAAAAVQDATTLKQARS